MLDPRCDVGHPLRRVDCGYPGIRRAACLRENCCWDDSLRDVIWCFYGKNATVVQPDPTCDAVQPWKRVDCGYSGIPRSACLSRGCCWDNFVRGAPWCFRRPAPSSTTAAITTVEPDPTCDAIQPSKRVGCGYSGITRSICLSRDCCWDHSVHGVPWCFRRPGPSSTTAAITTASTATTAAATTTTPVLGSYFYLILFKISNQVQLKLHKAHPKVNQLSLPFVVIS